MKQTSLKIILGIIIFFSLVVRIVNINVNPPAISWDEASIGYNAFTILTTGRDEHGRLLPLDTFAAFGDYKPPVPIYLTVPFVGLLGLNEWSIRLPSVFSGVATVFIVFLLARQLFFQSRYRDQIALVTSAVLAMTPWHIMLSRAGFEANIALFFLVTGIYLVLVAQYKPRMWTVAWLPFVLGIYTFNSTRYVGPLIAVFLLFSAWRKQHADKKSIIKGIVIACVALLPIAGHLLSPQARLRFEEVSIFTDLRTVLTSNERRKIDGFNAFSTLVHNRRVGYAREYLIHFFDNLEPRFLFIRGDGNPKFSIHDTGQLLLVAAPFLLYGFFAIFRDYPYIGLFLVWWLLSSIAPTAVARETPHALRLENGLPVYMLLTAYGIVMSWVAIRSIRFRQVFILLTVLLFVGNFSYFWHNLMNHYPREYSGEWQYGYKQAIEYATQVKSEYDTIVLTESIGRPYIYALFYEKYPLEKFNKTKDASFDAAGFYNVYGFEKYRFTRTGIGDYKGKTLYILPPKDVPGAANIKKTITLLDGTAVLVIFE
jgi:4-amino-4-deoxy-L-arabinose transferase-like glycosyltransferase